MGGPPVFRAGNESLIIHQSFRPLALLQTAHTSYVYQTERRPLDHGQGQGVFLVLAMDVRPFTYLNEIQPPNRFRVYVSICLLTAKNAIHQALPTSLFCFLS